MIKKVRESVITLVDSYNCWLKFFNHYQIRFIHLLALGIFILFLYCYCLSLFRPMGDEVMLSVLFITLLRLAMYVDHGTRSSELSFPEKRTGELKLRHSPFLYAVVTYYFMDRSAMIKLTPLKSPTLIEESCDYSIANIEKEEFHPFREMLTDRVITELEVQSIPSK